MARQIVVEIVGDASKFNAATKGAIDGTTSLGGKLKGLGKGMVIGAGIGAFGLLTSAVDLAVGKLDEAHQAFLDDEVSSAKLANTLKNTIPGWDGNIQGAEDFASAQAKLGFADDDVRDSLGQLVGVTHDLEEAQKLSSLAMDLARAKGIDLAAATDIITKAHEGNGKALKALGIDTAGATTAAGLLDAVQKNVAGSAAVWAQTNEGKLAVSNVAVGESMEKVGQVIDKVSQVAIPILANAFTTIVEALGEVWSAIQPVIAAIASRLIPIFQRILPIVKSVFAAVVTVVKALAPVFKIVFDAIATYADVWISALEVIFKILGTAIGVLQRVFSGFGTFVGRVFGTVVGIVKMAINGVIGIINGVIGAINAIQVHIHVGPVNLDWDGLNIGRIPKLHAGGVVPGAPGSEVLTLLQAGETVTPAGKAGPGGGVVIQIEQFIGSDTEMERFADRIANRLRATGAV